jgi:hypothetical protein
MTLNIETVAAIATPIIRKVLDPYGLDAVTFAADVDHDGDPVIRASLTYKPNAGEFPVETLLRAVKDVMEHMSSKGDERFVHLHHLYADEGAEENWGRLSKRSPARARQ